MTNLEIGALKPESHSHKNFRFLNRQSSILQVVSPIRKFAKLTKAPM
jgi:hypothetical protein